MAKRIAAFCLSAFIAFPALPAFAHSERERHTELVEKLAGDFGRNKIEKIFSDPRLWLDRSVVKKGVAGYAESTLFFPESIERGKKFLRNNRSLLVSAEKKWGVDKEIIAAILRLETNFGAHLGARKVINTLYSIYILNWRRRDFAFGQLAAFLEIAERNGWDPFGVRGSIAGAIGIPQFIPTSYNAFAVDGNNDGRIDLFDLSDAVHSVAHYLRTHGWSRRKSDRRKAIYAYNHSWSYVNDVLRYAELLKIK